MLTPDRTASETVRALETSLAQARAERAALIAELARGRRTSYGITAGPPRSAAVRLSFASNRQSGWIGGTCEGIVCINTAMAVSYSSSGAGEP